MPLDMMQVLALRYQTPTRNIAFASSRPKHTHRDITVTRTQSRADAKKTILRTGTEHGGQPQFPRIPQATRLATHARAIPANAQSRAHICQVTAIERNLLSLSAFTNRSVLPYLLLRQTCFSKAAFIESSEFRVYSKPPPRAAPHAWRRRP